MPTQSGSIDLNSYKMVNDNASKTATNYIQADSTGIKIANADPATATTYQHQTATKTEFIVDGTSKAEIGGDGVRLGDNNNTKLVLNNSNMQILNKFNKACFSLIDTTTMNGEQLIVIDSIISDSSGDISFALSNPIIEVLCITTNVRTAILYDYSTVQNYTYTTNGDEQITIHDYTANQKLYIKYKTTRSSTVLAASLVLGNYDSRYIYGDSSLIVGNNNYIFGKYSAGIGQGLLISGTNQLVCGRFNEPDETKCFIVGIGTKPTYGTDTPAYQNGFTVDSDGDAEVYRDLSVGRNLIVDDDVTISGNINTPDNGGTNVCSSSSYNTVTYSEATTWGRMCSLYVELHLNSDYTIPLTGSWSNRLLCSIRYSNLKPKYDVFCVTSGPLPVYITITTDGRIIATASAVSQDRTDTDYTTYKATRTMKISATYMTA